MMEASTPVEIFCSYAHADEPWRQKLETHLGLLKRQGLIFLWHDRLVAPGTDWAKTTDTHLETASLILLLVSADFFASDYCYGIELKRALERQAAGEARVLPILVRPVDWNGALFAHLQALPTDARPIASWQDEDSALADIAAGIRRVIVEKLSQLSVSAPHAALPSIWNIPYSRNPVFLGRTTELAQLHHLFQTGQAAALSQPQAISGLGGIGKTQLALEYAYRYAQEYQAVLWARAEGTEALVSSYVAIATLLHLPECKAKEQMMIVQAVKIWLQTHHGWLLILDNADDLALIPDFLPPSLGGHLLLTTRAAATGRLAHRVEIETLEPAQGALFLLQRAALLPPDASWGQASTLEQELALHISQELGGLPLALDQAGAYLEETGMGLGQYWRIYQQHRADLLERRGGLTADHPEPVATTWSLSFQHIEEHNPVAADLLRVCAFLAPDNIAEEILTSDASLLGPHLASVAADAYLLNQAIEALLAYSLVRRDPKNQALSIHRLVQAVLQNTLDEEERRCWAERVVLAVNATFLFDGYDTWPQCERILPHALVIAQLIEAYHISRAEAGRLLSEIASYLLDRTRFHEVEQFYQRALSIQEQALGPEHLDVINSLKGLADFYRRQGKREQAEPLLLRALHIQEQALGSDHPDIVALLSRLSKLYLEQGKFEQARLSLERALHICEQVLGSDHPAVASLLEHLGVLSQAQGKYEQAEQLYLRALSIQQQAPKPGYPAGAASFTRLAQLYAQQEKYERAEQYGKRALHIREQVLEPGHPDVAFSLIQLGDLSRMQEKYEQAEDLYQRALPIFEQKLGPENPQLSWPLTGLAEAFLRRGKYEQARQVCQRALSIEEQAYGTENPAVTESLSILANLHQAQGQYEQAERFYQRVLSIIERALGSKDMRLSDPLNDLANFYREQGKYEQAELLYQRALSIREQKWHSQHPETAKVLHDFALSQEAQGKRDEARALYVRALAIREQISGVEHSKTMETRQRLIALLHTMGQHEQAAQLEAVQSES